jgi:alkanesulfonate monooxygenase SsuD/methylene tetrahydromethanopterin reductase-like flavin-dependent oxidoreductase (luciferase family)
MHFSVFLTSRSRGPEEDRAVMQGMIEHSVDAERKGFDAIFLPDHHFTGYSPPASDPMMFAAYLAGRLPRMWYGFSVQTVALHHPVRFAERLALIDQLTDGKILVGTGSGTTPEEMIGFGVTFSDSKRLSVENLEIVERLWAKQPGDEPVIFDNGHYKGAVVSRIVPAPYSTIERKLMPVALRPESTQRAAANALPAFIPAFTPPNIADGQALAHATKHMGVYREALESHGHSAEDIARALEWTTHTYQHVHLADSDDQAAEELHILLEQYHRTIERERDANKAAEKLMGIELADHPDSLSQGYKDTWCLYGSPETVAAHLHEYQRLGIGNVLGGFMGGPLTEERRRFTAQTMRLFTEKVMPAFRSGA